MKLPFAESWKIKMKAGIHGCEIGYLLVDSDPVIRDNRDNRFTGLDLLRLAIPRRVYTDNHINVIAAALKNVCDRRENISRRVRIVWFLTHFRHKQVISQHNSL